MRLTQRRCNSLFVSLILGFSILILPQVLRAQDSSGTSNVSTQASTGIVDPDVIDSEWNHHVAGCILIGIALLVLASKRSSKLAFFQAWWPFLFVGAGLYLLAWSDKEIWPRGFLSWTWLIHHDAEARQHKIYGILLLVMGAIEYLRWRGKLTTWWRSWAFPILAAVGACLLLVHDHGGNSGLPPGWDNADKAARIAKMARASGRTPLPVSSTAQPEAGPAMNMAAQHHDMAHMMSSPSDPNGKLTSEVNAAPVPHSGHPGHVMTAEMLHVKAQHLWFTLVGVAIALFKFIDDGNFWRKRFVPYLWPSSMLVLGGLLVLYTEML